MPKTLAIPGLSLNPNTPNPQKNFASLLRGAPLAEKRQLVVLARHHHYFYQQPPHKQLQSLHWRGIHRNPEDTDKYQRNSILSEKRYTGHQEPADQLGYSCHSDYEVSHFKEEEKNGAGQRISGTAPGRPAGAKVFADCVLTPRQPASCFVQASFKHEKKSQSRRRAEKRRLVNRGEEIVGPIDEQAPQERVS